jgi:hypothetical protein
VGALSADKEWRFAFHGLKGTNRGIYAAGDQLLSAFLQPTALVQLAGQLIRPPDFYFAWRQLVELSLVGQPGAAVPTRANP